MKTAVKGMLIGLIISASIAVTASAALAAQPNNQACLGEDISGYARFGNSEGSFTFGPGDEFGQTVAFLAHTPNGVGDDVQAHMAGEESDEVVANVCND